MNTVTPQQSETSPQRAAHAVHALLQFLRVVRHRKVIVITSMAVCLSLGALFYATATRLYQTKASLLVLQTGGDVNNTSMTPEGTRQGLMPTYERLFSSAVVLDGTLKYLQPEDRVDLNPNQQDNWANVIRANLTATTVRQTNIIEVSYRSKSAKASVAVVNAVLRSYLDFMDQTHKGTAGEIIAALTKDKEQVEQKLTFKQDEVLRARRHFGDLGIRTDSTVMNPMVQRVVGLNEALIKVQQKRLELQASLAAIQAAVRKGEDLQQHLLSLDNSVGREVLLAGLGFSSQDGLAQSNMEKSLLEDESQLRTLQAYYGTMHPRVTEIVDRIQITKQYLAGNQARIRQRMDQLHDRQFGPKLLQMVQQRVAEAWEHESALRTNFDQARSAAVSYTGDLEHLQILEHDVKVLRDFRDVLLNKIASIDLTQDHGDIRTAVVSEPVLPRWAIWPKMSMVAVFSVVAGLGLGLGLIYVLDVLDDRFRSPEELRTQLGVPVLAIVRQMQDLHTVGLQGVQVHVSPHGAESEAFRTLRTTLAFSDQETTRLVVSSAEPGDGKTTVLSNLAVSYAQSGKRTLMIDADMRRPGLTTLLGMKGQSGLSDVLVMSGDLLQTGVVQVQSLALEGLDFLPAGTRRPNPAELLAGPRLAELLSWAESRYDQILIDSPPGLVANDAAMIGRLVDGLVLVVSPKISQRRLVMRAVDGLTGVGIKLLGIVVNRIGADKDDAVYGYGHEYGYEYGGGYTTDDATTPNVADQPSDDDDDLGLAARRAA